MRSDRSAATRPRNFVAVELAVAGYDAFKPEGFTPVTIVNVYPCGLVPVNFLSVSVVFAPGSAGTRDSLLDSQAYRLACCCE